MPIWRIWDHDRTDAPIQKVDKRRLQMNRQRKYKPTSITHKLKVTDTTRSTSRASEPVLWKKYIQATFDDLEEVAMEKNDALYGDAFND